MEYYSTINTEALILTSKVSSQERVCTSYYKSSFIPSFICLFTHSYHSIIHLYFTKIQTIGQDLRPPLTILLGASVPWAFCPASPQASPGGLGLARPPLCPA